MNKVFNTILLTVLTIFTFILTHAVLTAPDTIEQVNSNQLGLDIKYSYQVINSEPTIYVNWSWTDKQKGFFNAEMQDMVGLIWDNPDNWVGTTNLGEGGGGPALSAIEQLREEGKGLSYMSTPYKKNGTITFKLLPSPPRTNPLRPQKINLLFVHPEKQLFRYSTKYVKIEIVNSHRISQ